MTTPTIVSTVVEPRRIAIVRRDVVTPLGPATARSVSATARRWRGTGSVRLAMGGGNSFRDPGGGRRERREIHAFRATAGDQHDALAPLQGSERGMGVRGLGVVDERHASRPPDDLAAMGRRRRHSETRDDRAGGEPE